MGALAHAAGDAHGSRARPSGRVAVSCFAAARNLATGRARACRPRRAALAAAAAGLTAAGPAVAGKKVEGHVELSPRQAKVVTKFCFDFKPDCQETLHCTGQEPGLVELDVFGARRGGGDVGINGPFATASSTVPEVAFALLDDQYNSFPEVAQVWNEAQCTDLLRAARGHIDLPWKQISHGVSGSPVHFTKIVVERLRPRWWYLAFVSCSNASMEFSYRLHMMNMLQGSQSEFSMDVVGVVWFAWLFAALFGYLAVLQTKSILGWSQARSRGRGAVLELRHVHPAVVILFAAAVLAATGEVSWLMFFMAYQHSGEASGLLAALGRGGITSSKTLLSMLLLLFANGQCVCTPDISWREHRELLVGVALFGVLSFWLEAWSDSELRSTTTEYIYDTRVGMLLVAVDLLWLWLYTSRSWRTWQVETRVKPKLFYKRYGFPLSLWFLSLPIVAALGQVLAPWVRFRILYFANGLIRAVALGTLVYTLSPAVADQIYELSTHEYQPVNAEELEKFFEDDEDI